MQADRIREHRWGVILAGGEGVRLRSLTRLVSGDERPKQFCPLLEGMTLLARTRQRIAKVVSPDRTVFVLLHAHERYYAEELKNVPSAQTLVQPSNRGTLPAILCSLIRIVRLDPQAVVAFFPADHHYAEEQRFIAGADFALGAAEDNPETVILLGAAATHAEVGYGWMEAEAAVSGSSRNGLLRVRRFWEKPSRRLAQDLLQRGCVWNTFVMAGRVQAFLELIRSRLADLHQAFEPLLALYERAIDTPTLEGVYDRLSAADFSKLVLSAAPEKLSVLNLGDVGWSDLGDPRRVITMLSQTGGENEWVALWRRGPKAVSAAC